MPAATRCSIAKARAPEIGWLDARGLESKANRPTRSPSFSATKAVSKAAETARSTRGTPGQRLAHRPPGIERHDDVVVALGAIFLGDQHVVWRAEVFQSIARRSIPWR